MLARLEQARGNQKAAQQAIRSAEQVAKENPLSPYRPTKIRSDMARFWLIQGNMEKLEQLIQKSGLKPEDEIPYQRIPEYSILVRALLARSDNETAIALSERILGQAEATGRMGSVIEMLTLQALAFQGMKDPDRSQAALERALSLAQQEGYVRVFLDEGQAMTRMLCQVQARQVGASYASELLAKIGGISTMTQPSMQPLD